MSKIIKEQIDKIYEAHELKMSIFKAAKYAKVSHMTIKKYWDNRGLKAHSRSGVKSKKTLERAANGINIYKFGRAIRRITLERQVPDLFDERDYKVILSHQYFGKIDGINTKIVFSVDIPCTIYTENEENLGKAYNKALERMIYKKWQK